MANTNTKTNTILTALKEAINATNTTINAIAKAIDALCNDDDTSTSKKASDKKVAKKQETKQQQPKVEGEKKDDKKDGEIKYQVAYIHPSDFLDAYAYRMFVANLLTEKSYENIRLCKDIEKRKKYLSSLRNKAQKYNASHPDAMVKRPTQKDVIDIFHRNGWKLTSK